MKRIPLSLLLVVLSITPALAGQSHAAKPAASPCAYERIEGKEFTFARTFEGGETYGYPEWRAQPGGRGLPYEPYVGRKGKLTSEFVPGVDTPNALFQKAVLENCETVYYLDILSSNNYFYEGVYEGVYLSDDLAAADALVGKPIWINKAISSVAPIPEKLVTPDPKGADWRHRTWHLEMVTVTGVVLASYGHARCKGDFSLSVRKSNGVEGLLCFNRNYFFDKDPIPPGTSVGFRQAIENRKIKFGMTPEMVTLCLGKPRKITPNAGPSGKLEQWEYRDQLLFFEDGKLTGFGPSS